MLRFGRGVRVQYEIVTKSYVLLLPESIIDLNPSAYNILKELPTRRNPLFTVLSAKNNDTVLDGFHEFIDTAISRRWITEDKVGDSEA